MKYKIFVSGAQKELKKERMAVKEFIRKDALLSEYFDVFLFEDSPAKSKSAEMAYIEEVRKSAIYIGILGLQYGGTGKEKMSPTEAEFHEAKVKHKVILIYIKGQNTVDKLRDGGMREFILEIKNPERINEISVKNSIIPNFVPCPRGIVQS